MSLTVLIDEAVPVVEADLEFEFVPSSFAVQILIDGRSWMEVFATDANMLKKVRVPLATDKAYGVKLVMMKAHATHGVLGGKSLYGVHSFKVLSLGMQATVPLQRLVQAVMRVTNTFRSQWGHLISLVPSWLLTVLWRLPAQHCQQLWWELQVQLPICVALHL